MKIEAYTQVGGKHPQTAVMTNVLANQGLVAPHTGRPFSEAMILGIGGGLGCGYILWEFEKYEAAILVMAFLNRWNYPMEFMQNLSDRLGVSAEFQETGGQKAAQKHLEAALEAGIAPIAWIDQESLSYFYLRPMYEGCFGHFVTAFGLEEGQVWVDDRAKKPVLVEAEEFAKARARIGSYKNRLLLLRSNGGEVDVAAAVTAGIEDCVDYLGRDSQTFAIPVIQKWAKLMTDTKNKKGWPVVFKDGKGLYGTLQSIYEGIKLFGTDGGGLRYMYADFLGEAAGILHNNALNDAAEQYRALGQRWAAFADAALPERIPPLDETRRLLARKYAVYSEKGGEGLDEVGELSGRLTDLEMELNTTLWLGAAETNALFAEMQEHLYGLYTAEKDALNILKAAME